MRWVKVSNCRSLISLQNSLLTTSTLYSPPPLFTHHLHLPAIKNRRSTIASQSLDRVPPTKAEADALHQLYLKHGDPEYEPRMVFSSSQHSGEW